MYQNLKLFKDIVNSIPFPIGVYVGENLKVEIANTAMIETWGKGDQVIGKNYPDIVPEILTQEIFDQAFSVLKTGIPFYAKDKKVELVINGVMIEHYFNYSFVPLFDNNGKVYGIINTGLDVTDLHQAKEEIKSSNERLKIAIDNSDMGTYEIDLSNKKIQTSGNFNEIMCIDGDKEITNDDLVKKLHPEDFELRKNAYEQAELTGKLSYEARIINDDKSIKWIRVSGKFMNDEDGTPKNIIGVVQDIHERKEFEEELKKQVLNRTEELTRSNNDLLHFANVVSHDLREPLRKIKIFNAFLKEEKENQFSENSKKYLNKIDQSSLRMENIIEGILSYSTLDKTKQPIEKIDLNEVVENIKIDLELIIKEKNAILITSELPEIDGAPILITQLFYNLIQNALKFSKANQPPRITITSSITNIKGVKAIEIIIKDNGIGFESDFFEKIFTAFERLHSKTEYEGNGLGLSLCKKIVTRHNGTISASGEKDNGAQFTVTLPLIHEGDTI